MNDPRQVLQPPILHAWVVVLTRRQVPEIHGFPDGEPVILGEFLGVDGDTNTDEAVVSVVEEVGERGGDGVGVDELEDKAAVADAELESGDGVLVVAPEGGAPFNIEADNETVEAAAVNTFDLGDPGGDLGGADRDQGLHGLAVNDHVVHVVGVRVELVVVDCDSRHACRIERRNLERQSCWYLGVE